MTALKQREELFHCPTDWVYKAAQNREALQEGGTLRYATLSGQTVLSVWLTAFWANISSILIFYAFVQAHFVASPAGYFKPIACQSFRSVGP